MNSSQDLPLQGWTSSPDGRGTYDILVSSCITLVLCSWTVLCLNVFPVSFGRWKRGYRKFLMACLTFIGPEFTFQIAIGQWCSARRSVEKFKRSGYPLSGSGDPEWSMRHAFHADMGGFVLHPDLSETEQWTPFPLDAEQVHYLVVNKYVPYSDVAIEQELIKERNQVDTLVRLITVLQISWYLIAAVGRAFQHLAITILELATIGFIICTLGTYYFWYYKPVDIGRAIVIKPNATIRTILLDAGDRAKAPYRRTPLDFAGREDWSWTLYWSYFMGTLRKFLNITFASMQRPIDKIPDDYYPPLTNTTMCILFLFQTGYAAVHISGWNFRFPTHTEKLLWHITTLGIISAILTYWIVHVYAWEIPAALRRRRAAGLPEGHTALHCEANAVTPPRLCPKCRVEKFLSPLKNNSYPHDPAKDIPLKAIIPILGCCVVYCLSRGYVIIEAFINLRALPPSAYKSVNWAAFLPHF